MAGNAEYKKEWYQKNRDRILEKRHARYEMNKEKHPAENISKGNRYWDDMWEE